MEHPLFAFSMGSLAFNNLQQDRFFQPMDLTFAEMTKK